MPSFGSNSRAQRDTCKVVIQDVLNEAINHVDFSVVRGHREKAKQNAANDAGRSKLRWPNSRHNSIPSEAVDIIPYPTGYADLDKFYELATYMFAAASKLGVALEWGGHWKNYTGKGDNDRDWAHWEIRK
jgi:hypothetical protein